MKKALHTKIAESSVSLQQKTKLITLKPGAHQTKNCTLLMGNATVKIFVGAVLIIAGTAVGNQGLKQLGKTVLK